MIEYKDYQIERDDIHNISLYKMEEKEIREGGGFGKGPGSATGKFEKKKTHLGFFGTIGAAIGKILDLEITNCEDIKDIAQLIEKFKVWVDGLRLDLPVISAPALPSLLDNPAPSINSETEPTGTAMKRGRGRPKGSRRKF